jgi:hypothetical protein
MELFLGMFVVIQNTWDGSESKYHICQMDIHKSLQICGSPQGSPGFDP